MGPEALDWGSFINTLKRAPEEKQNLEEGATRNLTSRLFPRHHRQNLLYLDCF